SASACRPSFSGESSWPHPSARVDRWDVRVGRLNAAAELAKEHLRCRAVGLLDDGGDDATFILLRGEVRDLDAVEGDQLRVRRCRLLAVPVRRRRVRVCADPGKFQQFLLEVERLAGECLMKDGGGEG